MNHNTVRVIGWNRFTELLCSPLSRRMRRDIDVNESPAGMFNDHKHIENAKRRGDRHAEVARDDASGMIADKRGPALRLMPWALTSHGMARYVFTHGSRRDLQTELEQQFVRNPLLAPGGVIARHLSDERLQRSGDPRTAGLRLPPPKQAEALTMPAQKYFWFYDA